LSSILLDAIACLRQLAGGIFGIGIFGVVVLLTGLWRGWDTVRKQWKETIGIGIAAAAIGWMGLFVYSLAVTVYQDHEGVVTRWQAVVKEKDSLKEKLQQRDDYINRLESENDRLKQMPRGRPAPDPISVAAAAEPR
jgi:hypothetical protein